MTPVPGLPYAHLNLRTNPFRELAPEERAAVAVVDVEPWVRLVRRRIAAPGGAPAGPGILVLQLLGPPGAGKTTHLDALHRHFPHAPRVEWSAPGGASARARMTQEGATAAAGWPPVPAGPLLFLDDAHAFPDRRWPTVLRGRRVLVAASHRDLTPALRRAAAGGDPSRVPLDVRTVSVADGSDPHRLRRIVRRRMEWARRGDGPVPKIGGATVVSLLVRHGPDLRTLIDELYHHIQSHPPVTP